jgi:hypothetical protein
METDSHIIHHATWSINNESPLRLKDRLHKPHDKKSERRYAERKRKASSSQGSSGGSSITNSPNTLNQQTTLCGKLGYELRTLCCFLCFLTCKSCKFHSLNMYLVLLALCSLVTSMIQGGYLNAISVTLQTQFNIPISKMGFVYSSFDIMGVFATPFVSYIGSKYNKCRVIAICGFFYALGSVIYTFPYFFSTRYSIVAIGSTNNNNNNNYNNNFNGSSSSAADAFSNVDICELVRYNESNFTTTTTTTIIGYNQTTPVGPLSSTVSTAAENAYCIRDASNSWQYYMFILGQLLMSVGIAPLFSLGVVFLCDNLDESKHALYTGNKKMS